MWGLFILNLICSVDNWSVLGELNENFQAWSHYYFIAWKSVHNRCHRWYWETNPHTRTHHFIEFLAANQIPTCIGKKKATILSWKFNSGNLESRHGLGQLYCSMCVRFQRFDCLEMEATVERCHIECFSFHSISPFLMLNGLFIR